MSVWFVTPAWRRFPLSAVCFEQRRQVIAELAKHGIEAHCVVVADDRNLALAAAAGFETVRRDNRWLGRKFNDGIEYAGRNGAEWIVPIGSDSWIDPAYFLPLPSASETRTSGAYCAVTRSRLGVLDVGGNGAGPYMFHRSLLEPSGFRPAEDRRRRGIDGSTIRGILDRGLDPHWTDYRVHPLQYIGFRGFPLLNSYERLMKRWGTVEHADPWEQLARHYPAELVTAARAALGG